MGKAGSAFLTESSPPADDYRELKRLIQQAGLLDRQPAAYLPSCILLLVLLVVVFTLLSRGPTLWLQLLNAALLAFVFTHISFLGHDLGHHQVFAAGRKYLVSSLLLIVLLGVSREWWVTKHNRHHSHPNQLDMDPDVDIPVIAFTAEQARSKRGLPRLIVKRQAYLFFPMLCLVAFSPRFLSILFVLRQQGKNAIAEAALIPLHFALYGALLLHFLGLPMAALFVLVHQALYGLYMGSVFAPNHKGMPVLAADSPMDFLHRQVLTARNIRAHRLTDFWYGGLNYQIEHHLFPNMPRKNLNQAQTIVRRFCRTRGLTYYETGFVQSYREILNHLATVARVLGRDEPAVQLAPELQSAE